VQECAQNRKYLSEKFKKCGTAISAIGDETRRQIICILLENENIGMRVGEITARAHLSRPAVSHHLKVLRESGIIDFYSCGTKNFYYLRADGAVWNDLAELINSINQTVMKAKETKYPFEK